MNNIFLEEWVPLHLIMPPVQEETVLQSVLQALTVKVKTRVYFILHSVQNVVQQRSGEGLSEVTGGNKHFTQLIMNSR